MSFISTSVGSFLILRCEVGDDDPYLNSYEDWEIVPIEAALKPLFRTPPDPAHLPRAVEQLILEHIPGLPIVYFASHGWSAAPETHQFSVGAAWFEGDEELIFDFVWAFDEFAAPSRTANASTGQRVEATGKFLVRLDPQVLAVWQETMLDINPCVPSGS